MAIASEHIDFVILRASTKLGYTSFREIKLKAVKSFMEGNDVFVILPKGAESLCAFGYYLSLSIIFTSV